MIYFDDVVDFDFEFELAYINFNDWNFMHKVRPCLNMLVWVEQENDNVLAYLDIDEDEPFWVDAKQNRIEYKKVQKWRPCSESYMECVFLGETLKQLHEQNNKE
ncbi:hypothetical protein EBU71_08935 [bacterium]|jgi:hypothetical protein|nr:hypothetical protein [Candidatus Elulimicrobium humile]